MKRLFVSIIIFLFFGSVGCSSHTPQALPPEAQPELPVIPVATPVPTVTPTPAPTPTPTPEPTPEPPLLGVIIGIDPGHQLNYNPNPEPVAPNSAKRKQKTAGGTRGITSGIYEYEVNLDVGLKLRDILEGLGATVYVTHEVLDVDLSNIDRAMFFNEKNVDLGIRLHCNSDSRHQINGAFMLIPDKKATDWFDYTTSAATCIINNYCNETGVNLLYAKNNGLTYRKDQTCFNWCSQPICTIEMGYLTNYDEDLKLADDFFQEKMARGIAMGILEFFTINDQSNN